MASPSLRSLCFDALAEWDGGKSFADSLVERLSRLHDLAPRDRAFLNTLVLGVLRNLALLDHHVDNLCDRKLSHRTRWILRIGLYQLLEMRVPDHAAVGETVSLARSRGEKALVNAVLRRAAREQRNLLEEVSGLAPATRYSIPDFLVARWRSAFGEENAAALCRWNHEPAPLWVRVNALAPGARAAVSAAAVHPSDPRFFRVDDLPRDWIERGFAYVQDPSTAVACDLLAPRPGESVLDACAAPGGKACLLAELMENTGELLATDSDPGRLERVAENFERLGVSNAEIACVDWRDPDPAVADKLAERFDAILVDAPCTNTGVMRRRVDVRWRLTAADFTRMAGTQRAILENCLSALRPGGRLVYSTCSLEREENEAVVESFLAAHGNLQLLETASRLPFRDGVDGAFCALFMLRSQPEPPLPT